jgi:zinc transporter ZupT
MAQPTAGDKYSGRIRAAVWSKNILLIAFILGVPLTLISFDLEGLVLLILVGVVTYFEFRTYNYFTAGDPRAPQLGFLNQSCFAAGILVYGMVHAVMTNASEMPSWASEAIDADTQAMIVQVTREGYVVIGIVGCLSQFALAWYYRNAGARRGA